MSILDIIVGIVGMGPWSKYVISVYVYKKVNDTTEPI